MTETRLRRERGCLTDCVAYLLNRHPEHVPYFMKPIRGWNDRLKAYFRSHGFDVHWREAATVPRRGVHIVCGDSLTFKRGSHAVVYRNGALAYDPQFPSQWTDKRVTHRLVVRRLNP